jgi:hypothetical protein
MDSIATSSTPASIEITIPSDVLAWFASIPNEEKSAVIAKAMCEFHGSHIGRSEFLQWLVDMDYKFALDEYGVEMVLLHPASILLTEDPDKLPHQIVKLLDTPVSYTNFDICVDENEQYWTCPNPNVKLETGLDATGHQQMFITGADLETYNIGDCLRMGRYEMTDMSLWFAVPKHLFQFLNI